MPLDTKKIDEITNYIKKATAILPEDNQNRDYFIKLPTYIDNAKKAIGDSLKEEKLAYLYDAVTRWANQISFLLFRMDLITDELTKEFRAFESAESTTDAYRSLVEPRNEAGKKLEEERNKLIAQEREMDIFKAIVGGMDEEEAKARQAEYEKQMAQVNQPR